MNKLITAEAGRKLRHRCRRLSRHFDLHKTVDAFSKKHDVHAISRIYIINLDRKPARWLQMKRELGRFRERQGESLLSLVRRFSAIDATCLHEPPDRSILEASFTLADQLTVDPHPSLAIDDSARELKIQMSRQEVAVALSHIAVWRLIADGDAPCALVLEDDVFFGRRFARRFEALWAYALTPNHKYSFDFLYLAYNEINPIKVSRTEMLRRRTTPGVWEASAYLLTKAGAQDLLDELPAHGPIDMWLNFQYGKLRFCTSIRHLIEQRIDEPSTNSYSILPVLSQLGVLTPGNPLMAITAVPQNSILAFGPPDSGLTALASALSMLGHTCLSDLDSRPKEVEGPAKPNRRHGRFTALVNVGNPEDYDLASLVKHGSDMLFVITSPDTILAGVPARRVLLLAPKENDKWSALSDFLGLDYPSEQYPRVADRGQRRLTKGRATTEHVGTNLQFDRSPWILPETNKWNGLNVAVDTNSEVFREQTRWTSAEQLDSLVWTLRGDTFPGNLAIFSPEKFIHDSPRAAKLELVDEPSPVRQFKSAAIASRQKFLYGRFSAELRVADVPGLITGVFLHRNGPRQEIDIEFLGKDTTRMLINVYYNPGPEGTKMEYGYRGTPTLIDLGFDASDEFHRYEIEWSSRSIRWSVDGRTVYERLEWGPTPLPDQALEFNVNLWHSRSKELAGSLNATSLPATTEVRALQIDSRPASV